MSELADAQWLDVVCWSTRDVLAVVAAVREAKQRDPLRAVEDVLLDVVNVNARPRCDAEAPTSPAQQPTR